MTDPAEPYAITTAEQLAQPFGEVAKASIRKEVSFIHPHYRALIEASPFAVLATCGPDGLDVSPRGDPPGFVAVEDDSQGNPRRMKKEKTGWKYCPKRRLNSSSDSAIGGEHDVPSISRG